MGQFDTGATTAFASGMQLGMQGLNARRQHEMNLQRMALAQQAAQMRMQQMEQQNQFRQQTIDIQNRSQSRLDQQASDREMQTYADQRANTDLFDKLDQRPDPEGNYVGPFDDQHQPPANVPGALGLNRDSFSQASPQTQSQLLAPTLQQQRDLQRLTASGDIKRQAEDFKRQRLHTSIAASSLPDDVKEKLHLKVDGTQGVPMGDVLSPSEWTTMPFRQVLGNTSPETAQFADAYVAATGKFPTQIILKHMETLQHAANPQAQMRMQADMAHRGWLETSREHNDARIALDSFRKENKDALKPPTGTDGKPSPATDPAWATYNAAKQQEKPLKEAAAQAKQKRDEAFRASQQAKDQALGLAAPPPAPRATGQAAQATSGGMSVDAAAAAVAKAHPELDHNNPQHQAIIKAEMQKLMGQQPTGAGDYTPYDDQRADPMDDGDDDTTPDFDLDDEDQYP